MIGRVVFAGLAIVVLGAVAVLGAGCALYSDARTTTVGQLEFENELAIPPLLDGREHDGRRAFELTLEAGRSRLLPGTSTDTWGINGPFLGPTLKAERGERVELRVRNELPRPTTIHWHGMHLPARADGGPHQLIEPGETWTPGWTIDQPAATLWYHPHPHGETADHVYRGIAGLFIVDDPDLDDLPLPDEYGVDDIPLVIQDRRLNADGSLDFSQSWISPTGRLGETILVNGTYDPYLEIRDERVRFRLLNASAARLYNIGFADRRPFHLIATDAGLLDSPQRLARVQLSPGERAEIVATFGPGERAVLRSFEPELGTNFFETRFAGGDDTFDLLQIRAARELGRSPSLPDRLATEAEDRAGEAVQTRRIELGGRTINGRRFEPERIDEVVAAGTTEIWEVRNGSGTPHNFHPHGVSFRVLDYDNGAPPPSLTGPKDTIYVPPGVTVRLLLRFGDYSDPETAYMFHCHILEHEDRGMMAQFLLVEREARARAAARVHG